MSGGVSGGRVRSADGGSGQPNGATAAPNGGASARAVVRAAAGITKPEADSWYVNVEGDAVTGPLTVEGRLVALDPAPDNALTWTGAGLYAPPAADVSIPPEYLTEAEGDAAYAALNHSHPSEESGPWRFQNTPTVADPGAGNLRSNTGVLATATVLVISRTTEDDYDIPPPGWGVREGDTIFLQDREDSARWVRYTADEPLVQFADYATGAVTVTGSAGTIAHGRIVQVTFTLAGGGGGGGADAVTSVNGETGAVVLDAADVGALTQTAADARYLQLANRAHDHTALDGSGVLSNDEHDGYSQYTNLGADPTQPAANRIRLYAKDNGSGVATLYYISESGQIYELPTLTTGGGGSGAPATATYVTMAAESKLTAETALGAGVVMSGTLATRPAAATAGRLYLATDTNLVYRDTGSTWTTFATRTTLASDPLADAKGDLFAASGADAVGRLAAGADGQVLLADAAQTLGVRWGTAPAPAGTWTTAAGGSPKLTVQSTAPASPAAGDLWVW